MQSRCTENAHNSTVPAISSFCILYISYINLHIYIYSLSLSLSLSHTQVRARALTHARAHTRTHTHTHSHTHTHTLSLFLSLSLSLSLHLSFTHKLYPSLTYTHAHIPIYMYIYICMRRTESHVYMYIYINTYIHVYKRTSIYHLYVFSFKYGREWLTCCSFLQCVSVCSESVCCSVFSVLRCVVCIHICLHVSSLAKDVVEALKPLRQDGGQMQIDADNPCERQTN